MSRKLTVVGSIAAVALIVGAVITGAILAQPGRFTRSQPQAGGDAEIAAVVAGKNLTRGDVRRATNRNLSIDPALTESQATGEILYYLVERRFLDAEVERRGLVPTLEETMEYMAPTRDICRRPEGAECQRYIREMVYADPETSWREAVPEYRSVLGQMKLIRATLEKRGLTGENTTPDEFHRERLKYIGELRKASELVWYDQELQRLYENQVAAFEN